MLHCSRGPQLALSWRNLPCALKAAIGIGKRTLGDPASLARAGGRSKVLLRAKHACDDPRPITRRDADERLAQPALCRRVAHEALTGLARGKPPTLIFGVENRNAPSAFARARPWSSRSTAARARTIIVW